MKKLYKRLHKLAIVEIIKEPYYVKFNNVWEAIDTENWKYDDEDQKRKDLAILGPVTKQIKNIINSYSAKIRSGLKGYFNDIVKENLSRIIISPKMTLEGEKSTPLTSEGTKNILEQKMKDIEQAISSAYEEVQGKPRDFIYSKTRGGRSWKVYQWRNLLLSLKNRAIDQLKSAEENADSADSISKKKKFELEAKSKETYLNYIENLYNEFLSIVEDNKLEPADTLSDELLSGGTEGREGREETFSRGGRRGRTYPGEEGRERRTRTTQSERYKLNPFQLDSDDIYIKELLKAYGIADDLALSDDAPEKLSFDVWSSGYWKHIDDSLKGTILSELDKAKYVNSLISDFNEMRNEYVRTTREKRQRPNSEQLDRFDKIIGSLNNIKNRFPIPKLRTVD